MNEKYNHLICSELNLPLIWKWHISSQLCSLALHHMLDGVRTGGFIAFTWLQPEAGCFVLWV